MAAKGGNQREIVNTTRMLGLVLGCSTSLLLARDPGWFAKRMAEIDAAEAGPANQKMELLGSLVGGIGSSHTMDEEQRRVYERAQCLLLSIPGHAEYYGAKIREWKAAVFPEKSPGSYSDYLTKRMYAMQTLEHLPSVETVRVLAGFLDDMDVRHDSQGRIYGKANTAYAMNGLDKIVADPPCPPGGGPEAWLAWREEIEKGQSTFRVKGSEERCNFRGPVERQERARKNPATLPGTAGAAPPATAAQASGENSLAAPIRRLWPWVAGIVTLTAAGLWWLKRRKPAPPTTQSPPAGGDS